MLPQCPLTIARSLRKKEYVPVTFLLNSCLCHIKTSLITAMCKIIPTQHPYIYQTDAFSTLPSGHSLKQYVPILVSPSLDKLTTLGHL